MKKSTNQKLLFTFFYLGLLVGFINCTKEKTVPLGEFKIEADLVYDSIKIAPVLFKENKLVTTDAFLISLSPYQENQLKVFDLKNDFNYLGDLARKGEGPEEFYNGIVGSGFKNNGSTVITTDQKSIKIIKIHKDADSISMEMLTTVNLPGDLIPLNHTFQLNDSIYCGTQSFRSKKELATYNTLTKEVGYLVDYPTLYPDAPKGALYHLYQKEADIKPDKRKIAILHRRFPLLRIYDVKNKTIVETTVKVNTKIPEIKFGDRQVLDSFDLPSFYKGLEVTNNYIFARFQEQKIVKENGKFTTKNISNNTLHIFDWNGNAILKMPLEDWMNVFTVTRDNKFVLFIHPDKEDRLFRINLYEYLK